MPKEFTIASAAELAKLQQVAAEWHEQLADEKVRVALVFIAADKGVPAITHGGNPAVARCRIATRYERMLGAIDAIIEVDQRVWAAMPKESRTAVLDHELTHLVIDLDSHGTMKRHPDGAAVLTMRPDDWALTGFWSVVRRHGAFAIESLALRAVRDESQGEFDFAYDASPVAGTDNERVDDREPSDRSHVEKVIEKIVEVAPEVLGPSVKVTAG